MTPGARPLFYWIIGFHSKGKQQFIGSQTIVSLPRKPHFALRSECGKISRPNRNKTNLTSSTSQEKGKYFNPIIEWGALKIHSSYIKLK